MKCEPFLLNKKKNAFLLLEEYYSFVHKIPIFRAEDTVLQTDRSVSSLRIKHLFIYLLL